MPAEACDHVVNVAFNKRPVVGCPLIVSVNGGGTGPTVTLPGPGPIHRPSTLLINHPGRLEDIEVNVEGEKFAYFGLFRRLLLLWGSLVLVGI